MLLSAGNHTSMSHTHSQARMHAHADFSAGVISPQNFRGETHLTGRHIGNVLHFRLQRSWELDLCMEIIGHANGNRTCCLSSMRCLIRVGRLVI